MDYKKDNVKVLFRKIEHVSYKYYQSLKIAYHHEKCFESDLEKHIDYIMRVERAFNKLKEEDKELINNEFFDFNIPSWWKDKYSKDVFITKKREAARRFLDEFNEIN